MAYDKTLPEPDERTEPYWRAAKEHKLAFQRCQHCGYYNHPPTVVCPGCNNPEPSFEFEAVSGKGKLTGWTIMRDAFLPGFAEDLPFVIAMVEFPEQEGLRIVAKLLDGPEASLRLGAPIQIVFEDVTPEVTLPQIKLA